MAHRAGLLPQIIRQRFLHLLRPRLFVAALGHRDDAFENPLVRLGLPFLVGVLEGQKLRTAVLKFHLRFIRQIVIRRVHGEAVGFQESVQHPVEPIVLIIRKGLDGAQAESKAVVRQDAVEISLQRSAETHAGRASTEGIVKGENARLRFRQGNPAIGAREMGAEYRVFPANDRRHHHAVSQFQRRFHRIRQAAEDSLFHDDAIHHHFDVVLFIFLQLDVVGQRQHLAVHANADIAFLAQFFQQFLVGPFFRCRHRAENHQLRPFPQRQERVYDLIHRLAADGFPAVGAERAAAMGIEHTEIVVDFRHRPHRGAGIVARGFLVNGNRRRQPGNLIHVRLIHLP